MTGPEVMRAFAAWQDPGWSEGAKFPEPARLWVDQCYPLYLRPHGWYVRERMPGTRVWRAEEDGSFTLLEHTQPRPLGEVFRLAAMDDE